MRSSKGLLVIAAALGVGGLLLPRFFGPDWETSESTHVLTSTEDTGAVRLLFYSDADVLGFLAMWLATLLVAGIVGYRLARRP